MVLFLKNRVQNTHVMKTMNKISTIAEELGAWVTFGIFLFATVKLVASIF